MQARGIPVEVLKSNRLTGLRGADERETYNRAKRTLAVVNAPPGAFKLQPIPPSADWQFHLAEGCPAHCQYCYLAGSLAGPPVIRAFANLPAILDNLPQYEKPGAGRNEAQGTTFEASCYTDPLGIEHLTGSLAECIRYFGTREHGYLRYTSKFDAVEGLLDLPHNGHTRCRASVNAAPVARRLEGGVAPVPSRLAALGRLARRRATQSAWSSRRSCPSRTGKRTTRLCWTRRRQPSATPTDLTFELITHRFTPGSKDVLLGWYPKTSLDMTEETRVEKRNKFGGTKYVYPPDLMKTLRASSSARSPPASPRRAFCIGRRHPGPARRPRH